MEKENIFEGAEFGSMFLTRDGRRAVVTDINQIVVSLYIERGKGGLWGEFNYVIKCNGEFDDSNKYRNVDIVSKYNKPIEQEDDED